MKAGDASAVPGFQMSPQEEALGTAEKSGGDLEQRHTVPDFRRWHPVFRSPFEPAALRRSS